MQVQSDTQVQFDTESEMGQAMASGRRFDEDIEEGESEVVSRINDVRKRHNLYGGAVTQFIESREQLERLKGKVSDIAYNLIEEGYNKPGVTGVHVSGVGIVVVYGEKVKDAEEAEHTWWHEQTHNFWHSLPTDLQEKYGNVCFNILAKHFSDVYDDMTRIYWPSSWRNEACSFLVENIVKKYGADAFMNYDFAGNQNFINFANELRNYLRNGTGQQQKSTSNQSGRDGSNERWNNPFGRRHLRGRDNESERSGQRTVNKHQSRIAKHIDNLVEKLGTKARTTVYHSLDEVGDRG